MDKHSHTYIDKWNINECIHLTTDNNKAGVCIRDCINEVCTIIASVWYGVLLCCSISSKNRVKLSPYIVMILIMLFMLFVARIDPDKWTLFWSFWPSIILFTIAEYIDKRKKHP